MPPGDVDASGTEEIATIRGGFGPGQRAYVTTTSEPVTSGAGASRARWVRTADGRWTQGAAEAGFDAPPDRSDLFPWETKAFVPTADSATRIAVVAHYLLQESDGMLVPGEQATVEPCKAAPAFYKVVGPAPTINGASLAALPPLPNDGCLVDYRAWKSSPALPLPDRVLMVVREAGGRLRIERFEGGKTKVIRPDHGAAARSKYVVQWPEVTIHGWDDLELRGAFVGSSDDAREASFPVELRWDGAAFRPAPTLRGPAGATGIDASEITERLEGRLIGGPVFLREGPYVVASSLNTYRSEPASTRLARGLFEREGAGGELHEVPISLARLPTHAGAVVTNVATRGTTTFVVVAVPNGSGGARGTVLARGNGAVVGGLPKPFPRQIEEFVYNYTAEMVSLLPCDTVHLVLPVARVSWKGPNDPTLARTVQSWASKATPEEQRACRLKVMLGVTKSGGDEAVIWAESRDDARCTLAAKPEPTEGVCVGAADETYLLDGGHATPELPSDLRKDE